MPRVSIGDSRMYYERHGGGFPVLFVTGLSGYASFWRDQIPAFSRCYDVIVYDHRGVGQSDHVGVASSIDRLAADAIALIDQLGLKKIHIIGHSAGSAVAQILAIDHPERLASVVLAGAWTKPAAYFRRFFGLRKELPARPWPSPANQAHTPFPQPANCSAANNAHPRQLEAQWRANFPPLGMTARRIEAIMAFDRTADLGRFRAPTLVL